MPPVISYLFVYGTLRRHSPHPMAAFLLRHARYRGLAKTPGRLYDLGPYPGMLPPDRSTDWVHGDLYELPDPDHILTELDRYEGCPLGQPQPELFRREQVTVTTAEGKLLQAWSYFYCLPISEEKRLSSGNYHPESWPPADASS